MAYTPGTLHTVHRNLDGTPKTGYSRVVPNVVPIKDLDGTTLLSGAWDVKWAAGVLEVEVPPTDGTVDPVEGLAYTVHHYPDDGTDIPPAVSVQVASGGTVELAEWTPPPVPGPLVPNVARAAEEARAGAEQAQQRAETAQSEAESAAGSIRRDEPDGVAPLDEDRKLPEENVPERLTPAGLSASYAARETPGRDLWLVWWQSRPSGRGLPFSTNTDPTDGRVLQYGATGSESRQWILATVPLLMHDTATGVSPASEFGRGYGSVAPVGRLPGLVGGAHGSTGFPEDDSTGEEFTWKVGIGAADGLTNLGVLLVQQAKDAFAAAGPGARIVGAFGAGGEDEGPRGVSQATHLADLQAFKEYLCTELDEPDLLFVLGQMQPTNLAASPDLVPIDAAQQEFATLDPNVLFVHNLPGAHNVGDVVHDSAAGARFLGRGWLAKVAAKLWGAPEPVLPGKVTGLTEAAIVASTASTIIWDQEPNALGYYMEYRTSSGPGAWTEGPAVTTALRGTVDHLTPNTGYEIRVRAGNSEGLGPWSDPISITTSNPILVFQDTFTRSDAGAGGLGTSTSGQTWADPSTKYGIASGAAYHVSTTTAAGEYATVDVGESDGEFSFKFNAIATAGSALVRCLFRYAGSGDFLFVQHRRSTGKYQLYRTVGGSSSTQLGADFAATPTAGDVIKVVAYGDDIQVYVNGTLQVSVSDVGGPRGTSIGIGHGGAVSAADVPRWDNLTVYV